MTLDRHEYTPNSSPNNSTDMSTQQEVLDQIIDYIDKAVLKNSVSNRHVASALSFLNERVKGIDDGKYIRKDQPDSTDFLLRANGGLVVRSDKTLSELQSQISDSLSELDKDSITELGDEGSLSTALLELPVNEGIIGTLGGLDNVSDRADDIDAQDVVLVKQKGGILWETIGMDKMKGKDGVIVYPTMGINVRTGHLILSVPTNNYENQFKVTNGHLILQQNG
jgi:hypothetical protein